VPVETDPPKRYLITGVNNTSRLNHLHLHFFAVHQPGGKFYETDAAKQFLRERNARWKYLPEHPRHQRTVVKLRSKFHYPALSGRPPPKLPKREAGRADAAGLQQQWAWHWALLIIPWREGAEWQRATYDGMSRYIVGGMRCAEYAERRAACWFVHRCTWGMTTTEMNKKMFRAYRFSQADVVRDRNGVYLGDGAGGVDQQQQHDAGADDGEGGDDRDAALYAELFAELNGYQAVAPSEDPVATIQALYGAGFGGDSVRPAAVAADAAAAAAGDAVVQCHADRQTWFAAQVSDVKSFKPDAHRVPRRPLTRAAAVERANHGDDGGPEEHAHQMPHHDIPGGCQDHPRYHTLNDAQKRFVDTVFAEVQRTVAAQERNPADDARPLFWLDGEAGTGKTYATRILMDTVRRSWGYDAVLACAYQGNAACNLEIGAQTIHRAFGINSFERRKGTPPKNDVLLQEFANLKLLVIDEISMVPADMFDTIAKQLRRTYGPRGAEAQREQQQQQRAPVPPDHPFGGVVVLAMGDFLQLPPVKGKPVAHAALLHGDPRLDAATSGGGLVWRGAVRLRLRAVVRAQECRVQLERLRKMRADMVFTEEMFNGIRKLDAAAVQADESWVCHTSVHATNESRNAASAMHLRRQAAATGKLVYCWRCKLPESVARLNLTSNLIDALYSKTPEMNQTFLEGASYMVLENVNVSIGLTNGAIGRAHRLHFRPEDIDAVRAAEAAAAAAGVCAVQLSGVIPLFIELSFDTPGNMIGNEGALPGTVEGGRWIVPFAPTKLDEIKVGLAGRSKVTPMGFRMTHAAALTFHKSQGLTLSPLLLDVAKTGRRQGGTNMTWEMLYVGISRAPTDAALRTLNLAPNQSVQYLFAKKPHKLTAQYLDEQEWQQPDWRRRFPAVDGRRGRNEE
jgi:hypothetical protein